jgi:hypothetical protein
MSGVFFDPDGQGLPRDAEDAADPAHTRTFLIGGEDFLATGLAILTFRRQDANGPAVFTQVLLTAATIMAVSHKIRTAAFAALMLKCCGNHVTSIGKAYHRAKKMYASFTIHHYQNY